jgi:hypothetical protein
MQRYSDRHPAQCHHTTDIRTCRCKLHERMLSMPFATFNPNQALQDIPNHAAARAARSPCSRELVTLSLCSLSSPPCCTPCLAHCDHEPRQTATGVPLKLVTPPRSAQHHNMQLCRQRSPAHLMMLKPAMNLSRRALRKPSYRPRTCAPM